MNALGVKTAGWLPKKMAPTPAAVVVAEVSEQKTGKTKVARPVSDVVIIRRREDGTYFEKPGAPSFMRKRGVGNGAPQLPEDYYMRGSQAHLERRKEVGLD